MKRMLLAAALAASVSGVALADDDVEGGKPVTDEAVIEKLAAAVKEKGCEGGKYFSKGDEYVVDDAICDGNEFEITLDKDFNITETEME